MPNEPFSLAVCAEMVFRSLPIVERVRRISDLGFQVEIWDWTRHDIDALVRTDATFSSMTGYVTGTLADDDGAETDPYGGTVDPGCQAARHPAPEPARHWS